MTYRDWVATLITAGVLAGVFGLVLVFIQLLFILALPLLFLGAMAVAAGLIMQWIKRR